MESEFPNSAREAEEHIRQIRRDKGLGDGDVQIGNNASDLEAALELLSKDLYQTTTHFLLELIQNADDNSYEAEYPTLFINYTPGWVRVDCNERGFSMRNIEAICRICKSTKSGTNKSGGFVGEKGIGFKAVFKVASVVWISSGHYTFRFDRDAHLGMIAPIWDKFPHEPREGCTSILLKLDKNCDEKGIINQLESYDERMLLFLRRLRRLEIDVTPKSSIFSRSIPPFKTRISRHSQTSVNPSMTILTKNGVKRSYFVWRHPIKRMPTESRRPGISTSEIVLAFPNSGYEGVKKLQPLIESQNVYAFLPIRESGLPFLLQADFLLPASREDIHVDSPWNKALADGSAIAFVAAMRHMSILDNSLRFTWIRYIPNTPGKTAFIESLRSDIVRRLQNSKILDTQSGGKRKPSNVVRAPSTWRDQNGRPFMVHRRNKHKFLATAYDDVEDLQYLNLLGVRIMDQQSFFDEIKKIAGRDTSSFFKTKTKEWHTSFARTLFTMNSHRSRELAVIPLRGGKWVSMDSVTGYLHFPDSDSVSRIPEGIEIQIVDAGASADPDRRRLFAQLGVTTLTDARIRQVILETHSNIKFVPESLSTDALVSHAKFLFDTRAGARMDALIIWMSSDQGICRKSHAMYLPSKVPGAASRVLPNAAGRVQRYGFLHDSYLQADVSDKESWFEYLRLTLLVNIYPRFWNEDLGRPSNCPAEDHLHADFRQLMQGSLNQKCLVLLRDGWEYYKKWLARDPKVYDYRGAAYDSVMQFLRDSKVKCTGSVQYEQAKSTYMPLDRLTRDYGTIAPFVDLPDPQNPGWRALITALHISMDNDLTFYLKCLDGAKRNIDIPESKIRAIMHEIEDRLDMTSANTTPNLFMVQNVVNSQRLIHIPPKANSKAAVGRGSWVSSSDCFWRGGSWLTQSFGLAEIYPEFESLLRKHLLIPNAGIEHLIREADAVRLDVQPAHIKKLFLAFTAQVKANGLDRVQKDRIHMIDMFPIVSTPKNEPYQYLTSIVNKQPWLIADRANLRNQFQHLLPVLAFSPDFILKIKPFLLALDIKERFLSERATSITEAHGDDVNLHSRLTKEYRSRSKYFFRLIPEHERDKKHIRERFGNVEVYVAPKIIQYWQVPMAFRQIQSESADGDAFLETDYAGDLRIYLRTGYENEAYPFELVEQLRNFFSVPFDQRDLLAAALIAPVERVEQQFESRGISPLLEEEDAEEDNTDSVTSTPLLLEVKKHQRRARGSRFSHLFGHKRFDASFYDQAESSSSSPPSYSVAVARATQSAVGWPVEPRTFGDAHMLQALGVSLKNLILQQEHGAVVGTAISTSSWWDRFWNSRQRDLELGETIVSHIVSQVLGAQYDRAQMWTPKSQRTGRSAFNFIDKQGRFSAFLLRLDGLSGHAQGYNRFIYHMDVKTTDNETFEITQAELDRARKHSVHSQPDVEVEAPSKHIYIFAHISDVRKEPKIRFLADPWDLFEDGQLILETKKSYQARLNLRKQQPAENAGNENAGFDSVQIRSRGRVDEEDDDDVPKDKKGKEREEMTKIKSSNE